MRRLAILLCVICGGCRTDQQPSESFAREVIPGICLRGKDSRDVTEFFNASYIYIGNHPDVPQEFYDRIWGEDGVVKRGGLRLVTPEGAMILTSDVEPFEVVVVGRPQVADLNGDPKGRFFECRQGAFQALGTREH
ncbi:hypothetical protein GCM10007904_39830 [Oharaeibacter diazotrophicus]|nr:hypothetical protein GCM10007904_39830 [Oharaeibacter diazotrophicus]